MRVEEIQTELAAAGNPETAAFLQGYFKTGPGGYGAGDRFRGIRVPVLRRMAAKYRDVSLPASKRLLQAPFHEDRLLALFFLIRLFAGADEKARREIYEFYLANTRFINNWDLVDTSAEHIVGAYLFDKDRAPLYQLAESSVLWERRIAVMATFYFIRRGSFEDTFKIVETLLGDGEDLIHKAAGWMLREIGKRDAATEKKFLDRHHRQMPRTMLRYATEKFPAAERRRYLAKTKNAV